MAPAFVSQMASGAPFYLLIKNNISEHFDRLNGLTNTLRFYLISSYFFQKDIIAPLGAGLGKSFQFHFRNFEKCPCALY
jgi:hypothetical protein